jgi:biotin carboxyl carrier protein
MKNYTVTVNGTAYDVTVEEKGGSVSAAPAAAPKAAPAPAPAASGAKGAKQITAGAAGKVYKIEKESGAVKRGETILVLEVMKMETPVVAPEDGTVKSIEVSVGQAVEAGDLLATMD